MLELLSREPYLPTMPPTGHGGPWFGVYSALVTDVQDPDSQGRVRLRLPWTTDPDGFPYEPWARLSTLMAGANRGSWFIPEPDDEVLVAFEGGDPRRPIVLGALWNGSDQPPESMDSNNNIRSLTSRSGIRVTLDDTAGGVALTLETPGGQVITCTDTPPGIELRDANGNSIRLAAAGITIQTSGTFTVQAASVTISTGSIAANCGTMTVSGPLTASSCLITPSVVGTTYTPGAGNIL